MIMIEMRMMVDLSLAVISSDGIEATQTDRTLI
jgi:hypothetical protein